MFMRVGNDPYKSAIEDPEKPGGLQVDEELEPRGLEHRQTGGLAYD